VKNALTYFGLPRTIAALKFAVQSLVSCPSQSWLPVSSAYIVSILSKTLCPLCLCGKNTSLKKGRNCKTNPILFASHCLSIRSEVKISNFMISKNHHPSERAYGGNFPFKVSQGHSRGLGEKYFLFSRTTPSTLQLSTFNTLASLPVVQSSTRKLIRPIRPIPTYCNLFTPPSPPPLAYSMFHVRRSMFKFHITPTAKPFCHSAQNSVPSASRHAWPAFANPTGQKQSD
jgi:hypothetical protein